MNEFDPMTPFFLWWNRMSLSR